MKKILKIVMILFAAFIIAAAVLLGSSLYTTRYKITVVDAVQSRDGIYEVVLQAVGEPGWPFGSASGRLVLKEEGRTISKRDIEIANDGGPINEGNWRVIWDDNCVEIILSGAEQYDEHVTLYYDGQVESSRITTHYGSEENSAFNDGVGGAESTEPEPESELFPGEQEITSGYKSIYELYSDSPADNFEVYFGAKESSSRCILSEDENTVEYLTYSGRSQNGQCGIYVHYRNEKNADGIWDNTDGIIIDIYAYVYESGDVVSSGKTAWEDIGSEAFQEVTGEK